jgi:apolipoprotein N-acyltransferase
VVVGNYRDFFVVIATSAATLIGLLFVALSVSKGRAQAHPPVMQEFRSAASLLAFTNPFTVALFGLVPGNNIGYPAAIVGVIGVIFTAAGVRTILSYRSQGRHRRSQLPLIVALVVVFGFQITYGIELIIHSDRAGPLADVGDVLIVSLLIGIGRAWELVGDWDTGLASSIRRLMGHQPEARGTLDRETPNESK